MATSEADISNAAAGARTSGSDSGATQSDSGAATGTRTDQLDTAFRDIDVALEERLRSHGASYDQLIAANNKRTYDLHQSLDASAMIDKAKHQAKMDHLEIVNELQNQRFATAEHNQRLRHADFQVTALAAVTKEMVDTIAKEVATQLVLVAKK